VRAQGRPQHGRVTFKQANIDAIPKVGSMSDLSRALTVTVEPMAYHDTVDPPYVAPAACVLTKRL
jgi:hypothetical protein